MMTSKRSIWMGVALALMICVQSVSAELTLNKGDHIAFIGNALPDRMQHDGFLETYLQNAHADKELVIRNLGFTGDTVTNRPRNKNFMSADDYLTHVKADVIFCFFGYNESYANDTLAFKKDLNKFIRSTKTKHYNGESAPRIVLISPIAHEDLETHSLPDGSENNRRLDAYTDAMARVAELKDVTFVDLFNTSMELYEEHDEPLTINGIHLNPLGNELIAKVIMDELGYKVKKKNLDLIRSAVKEKNWTWHNRYRATDGNDVWGSRASLSFKDGQTNEVVLQHELVMLDVMSANRDKVIWAASNGKSIKVDDSNVPDPIPVKTNLEDDQQRERWKLGHKVGTTSFVPADKGVETLTLQEGFEANLFASEEMFPELVNPVQMDVDTQGRIWVAAWETYPKWQPDRVMNDRLLILPDENNDGVADKAITFAYVHNPTGFTFWNGGVLVASCPDILFLKDTDGDDVADVREVVLTGLDSSDTHHSANGFDYGPDGYIYYQRGIFNVHNIETPWGPPQYSGTSASYRFNPRTFRFAKHADNPPNPHGGDFDYWGYHYATSATGGEAYQIREDGDGKFKMHKLLNKTVRPVPSSGIISSQNFPEDSQGNYIILNSIGFLGIKQYTLENTDGIQWGTETDDLLVSSDANFRPADFKFGNDGAMYVADWCNPIIGHMQHNIRDPNRDHQHGRVYRVVNTKRPLQKPVAIDGQPIEKLLDVLKHPTDGVRVRARIELTEHPVNDVVAALQKWEEQFDTTKVEDAHHLLEALWLYQQLDVVNEPLLNTMLDSPHPDAVRAAERVKYMWALEGQLGKHDAHTTHAAAATAKPEGADHMKAVEKKAPEMIGDTLHVYINTVPEKMKYDLKEFKVKAGTKIKVHFNNPDFMPHNLMFVKPGSAQKIAMAAAMLADKGPEKKWVPESERKNILVASKMLNWKDKQVIEFKAPSKKGSYDYICTFPGHFPLMRGKMIVE